MTISQAVNQAVMNGVPGDWTFNEAELGDVLGDGMADTIDSAREFIVVDQGRITPEDLPEDVDIEELDNVRSTVHTVRTWLWALWLIPILLLVAIGFLCGRNWKSRPAWALGVLFGTCLILVIVVAVARTFVPETIIDRPQGQDAAQIGIVMADKGNEILHNVINAVVGGLEVKLILFLVFSGIGIGAIIAWAITDRRRARLLAQQSPVEPPVQNQ